VLVDTHCHFDLPHFDADRDAVIERATAAGVRWIVNPAIDLVSCRRVLALADRYEGVYAALGVHPNDCAEFDDDTVKVLRELAQHPKVVAIGEIGLDYYWNKVAVEQQRRALRAQLALAAELGLPVILHSRSAQGDASRRCNAELLREVAVLADERRPATSGEVTPSISGHRSAVFGRRSVLGVWHAFSGDLAEAQAAYELGLVLGLGGPVTFQNARRLHALIPQLRLDRLVLETDAPYLSPHPYRGQRNEPAHIPLIARALAMLYASAPETVAEQTTLAAGRCFRSEAKRRTA
jgi:TatD DNase family protein